MEAALPVLLLPAMLITDIRTNLETMASDAGSRSVTTVQAFSSGPSGSVRIPDSPRPFRPSACEGSGTSFPGPPRAS
jgi:hypothetical protein